MNPALTEQDWERIESLFHAAVDLAPAGQADYLDMHCDQALRAEVEALLAASHANTGLAKQIAVQAGRSTAGGLAAGSLLGHYRILRQLDEGGMGVVYAAERADGSFQQKVAIKILHGGLASPDMIARFERERQILAGLRHPNVAQLLDGGTTEGGLPYLVMEFIEGESITHYCENRRLDLVQRLQLLQRLCAAVQAAHQNLVVHRDIKPSNVMVQADGQLKLLDFGIAKLLSDAPAASAATQLHTRMMTPEYASPEQILGQAVTTATDVYALGAVAYRLLAGQTAFHALRDQPLSLQRAVCETLPLRPSSQTHPGGEALAGTEAAPAWPRGAAADLDAIVLRAMRPQPEDRYASAAALADDIARFLSNEPVQARQGTRRYLLRKFVARHALGLSVAAGVLLLLTGIVSSYTLRLATERQAALAARDQAEIERATAQQVSDFMVSLIDGANTDKQRPDLLVSELLEVGLQRIDAELASVPIVQARLLFALGLAQWSLGREAAGEARMAAAIETLRANDAGQHSVTADLLSQMSSKFVYTERYAQAEEMIREAMAIYELTLGPDDPKVADMIMQLDRIRGQRDHDVSLQRFATTERARRIYEAAGLAESDAYAALLAVQSAWHKQRFEWDAAENKTRRSLALDQINHGARHYFYGVGLEDLGRLQFFRGDYGDADASLKLSISIIEEFKGPQSNQTGWGQYYSALIERETGRGSAARARLQRLIATERADPTTADQRYLARALCAHALLLADVAQFAAAQRQCAEADTLLQASAQQRVQRDVVYEALGSIALAQGDRAEALRQFAALDALRRREFDPAQTDTPRALGLHASALLAMGDTAAAGSLFAEAIALAQSRYGPDHPTLGRLYWARAFLLEQLGDKASNTDRVAAQRIFALHAMVPQSEAWLINGD